MAGVRKKKKAMKEEEQKPEILHFSSDKELLDYIKNRISEQIQTGSIKLKVGDLLKIIELQKKLSSDSGAEEKFWEVIEQIRQEGLKDA